jgi:tetratricopeptide (TPR) repeat protein
MTTPWREWGGRALGALCCAAALALAGTGTGAEALRPLKPFADEQAAMQALEREPSPEHRAALAAIRFNHAGSLMEAYTETGDPGMLFWALDYAESAVELDPAQARYWFLKGYLYGQTGASPEMEDQAEAALRRAAALDPGLTDAQVLLGALYVRQQRHDEAIPVLEDTIRRAPEAADALAYAALSQAYVFGRSTARGARFLQALIDRARQPDLARIALAVLWREADREDDAKAVLQTVADDPFAREENREAARLLLNERYKAVYP